MVSYTKKTGRKTINSTELRRNDNYKCNVRLLTKLNDAQNHEIISKQIKTHNHEPDALREKVQCARNKIKENALLNPDKKPIHIISECESMTTPLVLANLPNKVNLKQTIYRQRKRTVSITEPTDIHFELNKEYCIPETAEDHNIPNNIIIIDKKYDNDRRIIIFTSKKLITLLCKSKYIIMDGTFKVVPKIFQQLYTIHGCIFSETFPCVFALCTNKDKNTYSILFTLLVEYCEKNNLLLSPKYIMMDFEKTAHTCARQVFENTTIKGCNFHLGQIIYRKIQKNGLQKLYGNNESFALEIKCLYALAFLEESDIPIYFDEWKITKTSPTEPIATWFEQYYVWGTSTSPPQFPPAIWSTHQLTQEDIPRTQNHAEAWHNRFAHFVGKHHPQFYYLARKITQEITHQITEIEKRQLGIAPPKKKKKYSDKLKRIDIIISQKNDYTSKIDFLKAIASNLNLK
ncbi:uncharacterized protein LOC132902984 [Amyelois transitella]|uniref:uncharacterized protein LOC132902984 n=1 Tax=Amyelois transitella TaxID=680683 RepID=UPI00298FCA17|nr:uncharacterized protein LOC132902984 [Amyelois transitella]